MLKTIWLSRDVIDTYVTRIVSKLADILKKVCKNGVCSINKIKLGVSWLYSLESLIPIEFLSNIYNILYRKWIISLGKNVTSFIFEIVWILFTSTSPFNYVYSNYCR